MGFTVEDWHRNRMLEIEEAHLQVGREREAADVDESFLRGHKAGYAAGHARAMQAVADMQGFTPAEILAQLEHIQKVLEK